MKKIIIISFVLVGVSSLLIGCLKKNIETSFIYDVSWENNDSLFVKEGTKSLVLNAKDDRIEDYFNNDLINLSISDSGGFFNNGNTSISSTITNELIKIPIKASAKPGIYELSIYVDGNSLIDTFKLNFEVLETVSFNTKLENITLSSDSSIADNLTQINIELNNTDTLIGTKVKFKLLGASGSLFVNQTNSIERIVDVANFKESFIVGDTAGNYSVKVFIDVKEEEAIYLPFTLTSIAQNNLVLNTTINNVSNPFIADNESFVSLDLDVLNLTGMNSANVNLEILQNTSDAKFVLNNSYVFNLNMAAANPSTSLLIKSGQQSGVIIVEIDFEGNVFYENIPVGVSKPDVLNLLPNSYSINSSVSSQVIGKVFHTKLNGKSSTNLPIYMTATQNNVSAGTFDHPVFYTDSTNEISFNFISNTVLDTLQPLILKAYTFNDNNVQIVDSVSLMVIP